MGLRELMILLLILAIVGVILRGLYVALRARRGQLRMALEKNIPQYDPDELISSELPNGGARLVQRSFEQVVKRNSEFTARDQAIPVLMDTLGEDEPLDEPPRASSVASARNAARQKHSQRTLKPVHRPIDRMASTAATPLAAGAAPTSHGMTDDEDAARHSSAFEQDDEPRDAFSAAGYRDDDDRQDDDYDDADDYADDDDDAYEEERAAGGRDDDDWDDDDEDDDDRDIDDDQDDFDDAEDDDYDDADDELAARGPARERSEQDDEPDDYDDQDDFDDQDEYDDEEDLPESWEEDQDGEDDEPEVEEFDNVYRDDEASEPDEDDVLLRPREGEGAHAESWYEEEEEPAAAPAQDTRSAPRRWLQWAGEKLSGMGAAAAEKAVHEPERVQRAEPVLGLDTFDDDQVSAPRTVTAPTRAVREPLDKSRQKELSLDHPEDEILRERAREREQKPARRHRDAEGVRQEVPRESVAAPQERSPRAAAAAVEPAPKQRPARQETSREEAPRQQARAQAEPPREPAAPDFSEVLVLNVVARPDREISGIEMLQVLLANQLRFGDMAIFHRHLGADTSTPVLFSVANLVNPGTFDLNRIGDFSTRGLCFFMTLPSAATNNMQAFDQMLDAAQKVRIALDADLKDDNRSVMTAQTIEHYRQRVRDFDLRQLRQAK